MANENEKVTVEEQKPASQTPEKSVDTFLKAAKEVKEGSVSKEQYESLLEDNKKLTQFILEGKELPAIDKEAPTPSIAELQKIRTNPDATNLEYVSACLGIRKQLIKEKGIDPFALKDEERESAERTANALQELVDQADGDPKKFNFLLESNMANDDPTFIAALKKRAKSK